MRKNEIYDIEITGMTEEGDGVGRVESMAVFIPYTIPGELVQAVIVKVNKTYAFGKLLSVIRPSSQRQKAECPYFYQCGGCQLWHMSMEAELSYKQQKVTDCLKRLGGLSLTAEAVQSPGEETRYRNKGQFPVTVDGIGFYKKNSHKVIPMTDCPIQGAWNQKIISAVSAWMEEAKASAYDEKKDRGMIRHIYTRSGENGVLVTLVTRTESIPGVPLLIEKLLKTGVQIAGILQNINPKKTNVVLGRETKVLWGEDYLLDSIGGVQFRISPLSFYQVNPKATETLYALAEEFADLKGNEVLWDLYCGIGTIGQFMAKKTGKILGVEIVEAAVENARENAIRNGIENATYFCGKAEELAPSLVEEYGRPDVVILDPPRKGCEESLLETVAESAPKRIVYVSCKPSTLARDLRYLTEHGYRLERVVPVNMFPRSSHVECVVKLSRVEP